MDILCYERHELGEILTAVTGGLSSIAYILSNMFPSQYTLLRVLNVSLGICCTAFSAGFLIRGNVLWSNFKEIVIQADFVLISFLVIFNVVIDCISTNAQKFTLPMVSILFVLVIVMNSFVDALVKVSLWFRIFAIVFLLLTILGVYISHTLQDSCEINDNAIDRTFGPTITVVQLKRIITSQLLILHLRAFWVILTDPHHRFYAFSVTRIPRTQRPVVIDETLQLRHVHQSIASRWGINYSNRSPHFAIEIFIFILAALSTVLYIMCDSGFHSLITGSMFMICSSLILLTVFWKLIYKDADRRLLKELMKQVNVWVVVIVVLMNVAVDAYHPSYEFSLYFAIVTLTYIIAVVCLDAVSTIDRQFRIWGNFFILAALLNNLVYYMGISPCDSPGDIAIGHLTISRIQLKRGIMFSILSASLASWVHVWIDKRQEKMSWVRVRKVKDAVEPITFFTPSATSLPPPPQQSQAVIEASNLAGWHTSDTMKDPGVEIAVMCGGSRSISEKNLFDSDYRRSTRTFDDMDVSFS